jgi:pentalenolactone synthase
MTIQLPLDQAHPIRPPGNLRDLQARGPVHRVRTAVGDPAWLVTGYRELQELFGDSRLGRSHPEPGTAARWGDSMLHGGPRGNYATEPQDHARFRARVQPHFSPRRMRELRPRVEALTAELTGQLAASQPPADLTQALALPLPVAVICELLGVPLQDREMFREWTQSAADTRDRARSEHGLLSLYEYGQRLVARKHKEPGDDIISGWCADPEVPDDAVAMLAMSLLWAGHETTVYTIGIGALMLLTQPEQWQALHADPALVPAAAEEALRAAGWGGTPLIRYARAEIKIAGSTIAPGDLVLLAQGAANHDQAIFDDPARFDIARQAGAHLAFGHGAHYCAGAPLARIELQAAFGQLTSRFPRMQLAMPIEELTVTDGLLLPGLTALHVTW